MTMRDQANHLQIKRAISPVSVADNTAVVSEIIDRKGFNSLTFAVATGSVGDAGAQFTSLLEESDASDLSGSNEVADADLITQTVGTAPEAAASFTEADDNEVRKLGYNGAKRYVRLTVTPANNGTAALLSAVAILGHPDSVPVVQAAA